MANRIVSPNGLTRNARVGIKIIGSPNMVRGSSATITQLTPVNRWRGSSDSTVFNRSISSLGDSNIPIPVKLTSVIGIVTGIFEADLQLLAQIANPDHHVAVFELDLSLIPPKAGLPIIGVASAFELDVSLIPGNSFSTAITGVVSLFEAQLSLIPPDAIIQLAPRGLTIGRIYPLPPGNRVYPVLPTGRNISVG